MTHRCYKDGVEVDCGAVERLIFESIIPFVQMVLGVDKDWATALFFFMVGAITLVVLFRLSWRMLSNKKSNSADASD